MPSPIVGRVRMPSVDVASFGEALVKAFRGIPGEPGNWKGATMASMPSLYYFCAWSGSYSMINGATSSLPPAYFGQVT